MLPYVAMGYMMSKQKVKGYLPYFLMFGRHPIFQSRLHHLEEELDPGAVATQLQVFLDRRRQAFREGMPLAIRNPAIA